MNEHMQDNSPVNNFYDSEDNDPIKLKTSVDPAIEGGNLIHTYKVVNDDPEVLEFRPTKKYISIILLYVLLWFVPIITFFHGNIYFDQRAIATLLFALISTLLTVRVLYKRKVFIAFDKRNYFFWKGKKSLYLKPNGEEAKRSFCKFDQIHAIQLISEYISPRKLTSERKTYYSYEINLVLKDGSRINVVDHSNIDSIMHDAQTLSKFLNKPIWDNISANYGILTDRCHSVMGWSHLLGHHRVE